jgi:hypothetical protein
MGKRSSFRSRRASGKRVKANEGPKKKPGRPGKTQKVDRGIQRERSNSGYNSGRLRLSLKNYGKETNRALGLFAW